MGGFRSSGRTQTKTSRTPDRAITRTTNRENSTVPELWIPGVLQNAMDIFHRCGLVYVVIGKSFILIERYTCIVVAAQSCILVVR